MSKKEAINQLDISTAKEILKWDLPKAKESDYVDSDILAIVRTHLRNKNMTPYEALENIKKRNSSMPKRIW
jgi:hypothetical protein